jgi:hypothetical protein
MHVADGRASSRAPCPRRGMNAAGLPGAYRDQRLPGAAALLPSTRRPSPRPAAAKAATLIAAARRGCVMRFPRGHLRPRLTGQCETGCRVPSIVGAAGITGSADPAGTRAA